MDNPDEGDEMSQDDNDVDGDEIPDDEEEEDTEDQDLFSRIFSSYQKISGLLQYEDGLDEVVGEAKKLFDAAKEIQLMHEETEGKVIKLEFELTHAKRDFQEAAAKARSSQDDVEVLKEELERAKRLADAAHLREQNTQEAIQGMRAELARVSKELEHKARTLVDAPDEAEATGKRSHEELQRELERTQGELLVVRERLERAVAYSREVEGRAGERERKIEELAQMLEAQETETSKETRLKERFESELAACRAELETRDTEVATLSEHLQNTTRDLRTLESGYKDLKAASDRVQRENDAMLQRYNKLQIDYEKVQTYLKGIRNEMKERKLEARMREEEMIRRRKELSDANRLLEGAARKADFAMKSRVEADTENARLRTSVIASLEHQLRQQRDTLRTDAATIEKMRRERELLNSTLTRCQETTAEQTQVLRLQEQVRRQQADELDLHVINSRKHKKQINNLQLERDRLILSGTELEVKVQETLEEVRLKQMDVYECKRTIAEGEARFRQQQNLYEAVRADRNTFAKHLLEAQDQISELRQKLRVQGHHVEQLKEDIAAKEAELWRARKTVDKTEKEKEELRVDLQHTRDDLAAARQRIQSAMQEERRLLQILQEAEDEHKRLILEMERMTNERDILGSQLVRRNDELSLLYEKIRLLQQTLRRGEAQYDQRLEDIRLLKIEVRRLRGEKLLLTRSLSNMADLRQECFHLERDLTRERNRVRALEEELQNPLNVHRWRKLQATDPPAFELVQKVQILQKRLLAQASLGVERENQLREAERLYAGLRALLERQPGPEAALRLYRTRTALRMRGRRMQAMAAELSMYEAQVMEYKIALDRSQTELCTLKRKYNAQIFTGAQTPARRAARSALEEALLSALQAAESGEASEELDQRRRRLLAQAAVRAAVEAAISAAEGGMGAGGGILFDLRRKRRAHDQEEAENAAASALESALETAVRAVTEASSTSQDPTVASQAQSTSQVPLGSPKGGSSPEETPAALSRRAGERFMRGSRNLGSQSSPASNGSNGSSSSNNDRRFVGGGFRVPQKASSKR